MSCPPRDKGRGGDQRLGKKRSPESIEKQKKTFAASVAAGKALNIRRKGKHGK